MILNRCAVNPTDSYAVLIARQFKLRLRRVLTVRNRVVSQFLCNSGLQSVLQ
jgi:hypothetical protein